MVRFETFYLDALQRFVDYSFNIPKLFDFVRADKRDSIACRSCPACSANTVYIVFGHMRQVKIDDHWQLRDIDPSGGDISRYEYLNLAAFEVFKRFGSLGLTFIAMNGRCTNPCSNQIAGEFVCSVLSF
jgi:hypothetical protein